MLFRTTEIECYIYSPQWMLFRTTEIECYIYFHSYMAIGTIPPNETPIGCAIGINTH